MNFSALFPITLAACDDTEDTCKWRNNPPLRMAEAEAIKRLPSIHGVTIGTGLNAPMKYRDRQLSSAQVDAKSANWLEVGVE